MGGGRLKAPKHVILRGFTLAEVLVTLGIIGIVGALTMPAVLAEHQKKVLAGQTKRFYSLLSQAYISAELHNGEVANWEGDNNYSVTVFEKYIFPEMKGISSTDDTVLYENCIDYINKTEFRTSSEVNVNRNGCFLLASGEIVMPNKVVSIDEYYLTSLMVDVNGFKKPNKQGKDIHSFFIVMRPASKSVFLVALDGQIKDFYKAGIFSSGYGLNLAKSCNSADPINGKNMVLCTAKLMQDGWEFKGDYPW